MIGSEYGGEKGPVIFTAFKAVDSVLRGPNGGFDSHTLPPTTCAVEHRPFSWCVASAKIR
jgi:hypothetical protein